MEEVRWPEESEGVSAAQGTENEAPGRSNGQKARRFWVQRPLVMVALFYGVGIGAGAFFDWRPLLYLLGLGMAIGMAILLRGWLKRSVLPGILAAVLMLGLLAGGYAAHPTLPDAGRYQVRGVLEEDAALREDGTASAYLVRVELKDEAGNVSHLSRVYWTFTPPELEPIAAPDTELSADEPLIAPEPLLFLPQDGQEVSFTANLYHPHGQENPYGFDFRLFLLKQGAVAGVSGAKEPQVVGNPGRGLASGLYRLKKALIQRAEAVFGEESALPLAMLLGDRERLPDEVREHFTDAGVAHLLSISGLHVMLLAGCLDMLLRAHLSLGKRSACLGGFLLFYSALLGFPAPVVRASLLMGVERVRRLRGRPRDALTGLAFAFLLILLFRPLSLLDAGFQLSFCAVLGMAAWSRKIKYRLRFLKISWLRDGIAATISATAGSALPCIQCFHRFSLIGLLINPGLCAVFTFLLPAYFVTLGVGICSLSVGQFLARLINPVSKGIRVLIDWLAQMPWATVRAPYLPWYMAAALALAALLSTRLILGSRRRKALCAVGTLVTGAVLWRLSLCPDVQYIQFAMGQADAAMILDGGKTALIDVGDYGGDLASYLLSTGRKADTVFITHLHSDHFMGLQELLEQKVPIGCVYLPMGAEEQDVDVQCLALLDRLRQEGVAVEHLKAGDRVLMERVTLSVLWPDPATVHPGGEANESSMVLLCDLDGVRLLTAGDLSGTYEMYTARPADILKVAHHGSASSTSAAYLAAVSPQVAILTVQNGRYALPHPDTLARLDAQGVPHFATADFGALTFRCRDGQAAFTPFLSSPQWVTP